MLTIFKRIEEQAREWLRIELELKRLRAMEYFSMIAARIMFSVLSIVLTALGLLFALYAAARYLEAFFNHPGMGWLIVSGSILFLSGFLVLCCKKSLKSYFRRKALEIVEDRDDY
jgi:uncharacterized membrane protein YedE/YeeE